MFLNDDKDSRSVFCETSDNASVSRLENVILVLLRFFTESFMANDDSVLRSIRAKSLRVLSSIVHVRLTFFPQT